MSDDDKLIDLNAERAKRVHDLNDKRLNEVRQAFEHADAFRQRQEKIKEQTEKALTRPASVDAGQLIPFFTPRCGRH